MSTLTIVAIQQQENGGLFASLRRAPVAYPDAQKMKPIVLPPLPALNSKASVSGYGTTIRDALLQHSAIKSALEALFAAGHATPQSLRFEISAPDGEAIRWETICDSAGRFLAVERACRLTRVADSVTSSTSSVRFFDSPLRIAAFLSAAGVPAKAERDELIAKAKAAVAGGAAIALDLYFGEQELLDDTLAMVTAQNLGWLRAAPIPSTTKKLEGVLSSAPPQVVHFFCHGRAHGGYQAIELASIVDWDVGDESGSVTMDLGRLMGNAGIGQAWLVVLNCCEGAAAGGPLFSMAASLVREGVPACLGMTDPIAGSEANIVTGALYEELFSITKPVFTPAAELNPVTLDFDAAVVSARVALHDMHAQNPATYFRWLLPLLYNTSAPLMVQRRQNAEALQVRLAFVAQRLKDLAADTPIDFRQDVWAMLDRPPAVPASLRPDLYGNFPAAGAPGGS